MFVQYTVEHRYINALSHWSWKMYLGLGVAIILVKSEIQVPSQLCLNTRFKSYMNITWFQVLYEGDTG